MSKSSSLTPWTPAQPERRQGERRTKSMQETVDFNSGDARKWMRENPGVALNAYFHAIDKRDHTKQSDRRTALQHYGEQAELAEALRDARRYRWMRENQWFYPIVRLCGEEDFDNLDGAELDAAIDQQLKQLAAGSGEK